MGAIISAIVAGLLIAFLCLVGIAFMDMLERDGE